MKVKSFVTVALLVLMCLMESIHAFRSCISRDPAKWVNAFTGYAKGLRGSFITSTDCLASAADVVSNTNIFFTAVKNIPTNVLKPMEVVGTILISFGNFQTACNMQSQAAMM